MACASFNSNRFVVRRELRLLLQDVDPFVALFKSMDIDGSGRLTGEDLMVIATQEADRVMQRLKTFSGRSTASLLRVLVRCV